jgi:hypothetical protein
MACYFLIYVCVCALMLSNLTSALKNVENEVIGIRSFKQGPISSVSKSRTKRDLLLSEVITCIRTQSTVDQRIKDMSNASRKMFAEEVEYNIYIDVRFSIIVT